MHGVNCHVRQTMGACTAGKRTVDCTVISGAVVPCWGELERTLDRNAHKFNKADRGMRTVRVVDEVGRKVIGLRYPETLLALDANLPSGVTLEGIMSHVNDDDLEGKPISSWQDLKLELRSALLELGVQVGLRNDGFSVEEATLLQEIGYGNKDLGDVRKFLNRLLGLPVRTQNIMFAYFAETLDCEIKLAKAEGKYTEGVSDLGGSSIRIEPESKTILKDLTENANKRTKAECCICGEQFPEGAKSETINAHIDKCLKDGEPL